MATDYKELARQARIKILEMIHRGQTSHIASNFSVVDVATVLYENLKPEDEVVWSKAWAAAAIYYFLAKQGKIPEEDLDKFPNPPYIGLAETGIPAWQMLADNQVDAAQYVLDQCKPPELTA